MIDNKFSPKIKYIPTQTPGGVSSGEEPLSNVREFYSYSDEDYEYFLYRTKDRSAHSLKIRERYINSYSREEPSEQNNYNLEDELDYRNLFDEESIIPEPPEGLDAFVNPGYILNLLDSFFGYLEEIFYARATARDFTLLYFLSTYFYISEYVWPTVSLYFPFLDYFSLTFIFGWEAFLENHFFALFFTFYFPFVLYIFFFWRYGAQRRLLGLFSFFRFGFIFFISFFLTLFFSTTFLSWLFFFPAIVFLFFLTLFFPFSSQSDELYNDYYLSPKFIYLLPAPKKPIYPLLPIYHYCYTLFPESSSFVTRPNLFKSRAAFVPFLRMDALIQNKRRILAVYKYQLAPVFYDAGSVGDFSHYLQPYKHSGLVREHFPLSFGYSPDSHIILEAFTKDSNVEADNESGLRPQDYIIDFMINEVGVSNVRFFLSENYHLSVFHHYSANFLHSSDSYDLYSPTSYIARVQTHFGAYYSLALWLTLIKPLSSKSVSTASSFSSFSLFELVDSARRAISRDLSFFDKWYLDFGNHSFIPSFYKKFINFFLFFY